MLTLPEEEPNKQKSYQFTPDDLIPAQGKPPWLPVGGSSLVLTEEKLLFSKWALGQPCGFPLALLFSNSTPERGCVAIFLLRTGAQSVGYFISLGPGDGH